MSAQPVGPTVTTQDPADTFRNMQSIIRELKSVQEGLLNRCTQLAVERDSIDFRLQAARKTIEDLQKELNAPRPAPDEA